jgi:hypothetical protein
VVCRDLNYFRNFDKNNETKRISTGISYLDHALGGGKISEQKRILLPEHNYLIRMITGITGFDWMFSKNIKYMQIEGGGLARGKLSVWAGESGVGKSRMAISIANNIHRQGKKVVFFQLEVSLNEFNGWTKDIVDDPNGFMIANDTDIDGITEVIYKEKPDFVVIDSANMIDGFNHKEHLVHVLKTLKSTAEINGCHIVLLGQMTKGGSYKGDSGLKHLVDYMCLLSHYEMPRERKKEYAQLSKEDQNIVDKHLKGLFEFKIDKNRCGPSGSVTRFKHYNKGVFVDWSEWHQDHDKDLFLKG